MGQAKQRGTYQERKRAALAARADNARRILRERMARDAAMTPEERKKRLESRMLIATMLGIAAGSNTEFQATERSEGRTGNDC